MNKVIKSLNKIPTIAKIIIALIIITLLVDSREGHQQIKWRFKKRKKTTKEHKHLRDLATKFKVTRNKSRKKNILNKWNDYHKAHVLHTGEDSHDMKDTRNKNFHKTRSVRKGGIAYE